MKKKTFRFTHLDTSIMIFFGMIFLIEAMTVVFDLIKGSQYGEIWIYIILALSLLNVRMEVKYE